MPKLYDAGWTDDQISEQKYFTDGRIVPVGRGHVRKVGKRADYLQSGGELAAYLAENIGYASSEAQDLASVSRYAAVMAG